MPRDLRQNRTTARVNSVFFSDGYRDPHPNEEWPITGLGFRIELILQYFLKTSNRVQNLGFGQGMQCGTIHGDNFYPLQVLLLLRNNVKLCAKGIEVVELKEGQFVLARLIQNESFQIICKEKECELFVARFTEEYLREFLECFPMIDVIGKRLENPSCSLVNTQAKYAMSKIIDMVNEIIKPNYGGKIRDLLLKNKVKEYLLHIFIQTFETRMVTTFSLADREKANKIRQIVTKNNREHYTIAQLTRLVGLNECKLKVAFKQMYGMGIYKYQLTYRLREAEKLILETSKPIKEVSSIAGYYRVSSFITAFRKYFGYTPGALKRNVISCNI